METMTHEEVLQKYIGEVGTPEREEFEANVKKEADDYFIGIAVREARKRQGLTQEQLGERMGVQKAEISKIERGKSVTLSTLVRVFQALGVRTATLDLGDFGRVALW